MGILGLHDEEVIGTEKIEASHAGGYDATDEIELVAVADVDEETLERFGEAWEIPSERRYVGHEAMLDAEDLDVVSICTPRISITNTRSTLLGRPPTPTSSGVRSPSLRMSAPPKR